MRKRDGSAGPLAVVLAMAGWGFNPVFVKLMSLNALSVAFYRLWIGWLVMAAAQAAMRRRIDWAGLKASVAAGALFGVNVVLFFGSLKLTSIANATLISNLSPILVFFVAGRWFGEKVGARDVFWAALAIGGVGLVVIGSAGIPVWSPVGDMIAFGALVTWCAFFLLTKRLRARTGAVDYMTGVMLGASIVVTPVALFSGQSLAFDRGKDFVWMGLLILLGNGGHVLMTWAHRHVDVSVSSVILLGNPVVAAAAALVILGEPIRLLQVIGGAIVLLSVGAIARRAAIDAPEPVPS